MDNTSTTLTSPLTILVDMDGVLCDYTKAHLEKVAERLPHLAPYIENARLSWRSEDCFPEEYRDAVEALALEPGFFENLEPIEGSLEAMRALRAKGHEVFICTAPKKIHTNCVLEKYNWVKKHLGQEFVERIIMTRDKTLTQGHLLIDDKPEVTGTAVPSWEHIIFDRPYNSHIAKRRIDWSNYKKVLGL